MKMFNKKLHELLQEEFGKRGIEQIEIPFYVKENLSKELREKLAQSFEITTLEVAVKQESKDGTRVV